MACTLVRSASRTAGSTPRGRGRAQQQGGDGRRGGEADRVELAPRRYRAPADRTVPFLGALGSTVYTRIGTTSRRRRPAARRGTPGTDPSRHWCRVAGRPPASRRCRPPTDSAAARGRTRPPVTTPRAGRRPVAPARLGPAGDDAGLAQCRGQFMGQPLAVGRGDPAAQPDAGGGDDDVRGAGDQGFGCWSAARHRRAAAPW